MPASFWLPTSLKAQAKDAAVLRLRFRLVGSRSRGPQRPQEGDELDLLRRI